MRNTIFFDLDGTLLPMDVEEFIRSYFSLLAEKLTKNNYDAKRIMDAVSAGTGKMIKNKSSKTNEEVFWTTFEELTQIKKENIEDFFADFYENEFNLIGKKGVKSENMIEVVKELKHQNKRLILTTNPLFPRIAVEKRIEWAGLDPRDFDYITSYENSHACKPSLEYYHEVISNTDIDIHDTMMIGNDSLEDGIVEACGIPLYLVEDYLIHRESTELKSCWHGTSEQLLEFVKAKKMDEK